MNERELISRIKQDLNYGTGRLKTQVTDGLRQSRERALEAFAAQSQTESAYAFAGHPGHGHPFVGRKWLPLALVSLLLIGVIFWQQQEPNNEENIDLALLTSEIPLNAFVDQNFHQWLKQSSQN